MFLLAAVSSLTSKTSMNGSRNIRREEMGSHYKQKNSKIWWIKFYVNGRAIRESTGTESETEADKILKLHEGQGA